MSRALLICETAPGTSGGSQRYHLQIARGMASLGIEVHALYASAVRADEPVLLECTASRTGPFDSDDGLLARRARQVKALLARRCSLRGASDSERMRAAVLTALDRVQPDLVVVSHLRVGGFVNMLRECGSRTRIMFASHNCETDVRRLYARWGRFVDRSFARLDLPKVRDFERSVIQAADVVTAISWRDARIIEHMFGVRVAAVLPPCLWDPPEVDWADRARAVAQPKLLHCGTFCYRAKAMNLEWFLDQVYPQVLRRVPAAQMVIVGPGASWRMRRAAGAQSGVSVLGWVDDLDAQYAGSGVFVLPTLVGGGFELKTLEAAAHGCALVGTSIPLEAAGLQDGVHCLLGDTPAQLADALARILTDPDMALRLARAANGFVRETYCWDSFRQQLGSVLLPSAE